MRHRPRKDRRCLTPHQPTLRPLPLPKTFPAKPKAKAVIFIENGWSLKKLHRPILTSQAYQQDSKIKSGTSKQFLRQRLKAEIIRDSALAFRRLLTRPPTEEEVRLLSEFHKKHSSRTSLTRALLSLDESVTKP